MTASIPSVNHVYRRVYEGLNYRLRTFAGGRFADHCRPTSIGFMVTDRCNAKCVHCDIWKNRGQEDTPTVEQWKQMLSDLRAWLGPVHFYFTGGEALLRAWSTELAAYAASLGLFVEFLTHGYWEDQTRIEALAHANIWRITMSLDGIGEAHSIIRGKAGFFEKTMRSFETIKRVRKENGYATRIRLKTVVMSHNLHDVGNVAKFASKHENVEVFYQAVEQNYNTPEDSRWFEKSPNWPKDTSQAIAAVKELIQLKREGMPIANSFDQLEVMIPYFENPDSLRVQIQSHQAHEHKALCTALVNMQFLASGDVLACYGQPPVGNIKNGRIRDIWENRPKWWKEGCCLTRRCTDAEKSNLALTTISV